MAKCTRLCIGCKRFQYCDILLQKLDLSDNEFGVQGSMVLVSSVIPSKASYLQSLRLFNFLFVIPRHESISLLYTCADSIFRLSRSPITQLGTNEVITALAKNSVRIRSLYLEDCIQGNVCVIYCH